ncbi:ABC transporter permease [Bradyrhizobium sp. 137]|uniref:ABC transporter permease n=1 Tax=Bradyrhizobium sp. 137 TaxID=2782614 RepID=UPI001FF964FD|nr:ABC transporter permease [Bradyrhizobium sp. 137]MCK1756226.1 ABC transporter permease [Bradyrhizobium sp. 137]
MLESFVASSARFRRSHEFWLLIVTLMLCVGLSVANGQFLTMQNLFDLLTSYAFVGILALGLLVVRIAGGIDISFTATASVAQYVALAVANAYGANWLTVCAMAMAIGAALGAINAVLIQKLRIPSIIVSIATLNVFYGLLIFFTGGKYIYSLPDWFAAGIFWFEFDWGKDASYGVNLQMLALAICFLVTWLLLNRTNIGRQIYAMGGNADAARRLGFHIFGLNMLVYCYMGIMAGVASLVQAQLAQSVAPTVLVGKELDVVAAVVLGGASLMGGVGTVLGTFLGLALLAVLQNGLILLGVSSYWSPLFVGFVILVSVSVTAWSQRERHARGAGA